MSHGRLINLVSKASLPREEIPQKLDRLLGGSSIKSKHLDLSN